MFISSKKSEFMKEHGYLAAEVYMDYQNYAKKFGFTGCSIKKFGSELNKYCSKVDKRINGKTARLYKLKDEYVNSFEEVIDDEEIALFDEV